MFRANNVEQRPLNGRDLATSRFRASRKRFTLRRTHGNLVREEALAGEMEVLSRASQAIAHDLRNVFSVVEACAVDLYDEMHGRAAAALVLEILHAAEQGLMATTDLMRAGRVAPTDDLPIDISLHTSELEALLRRLATPDVTLKIGGGDAPVFVRIDRTSVLQILVNLVDNASDATRRSGAVAVECGRGERLGADGLTAVPVGYLMVTDDGPGIPSDQLDRIFEVGFSTKQGTHCGLGLAVVQRVVERCHGWIAVHSGVGEGTSFRVEFPLVEPACSRQALVVVADDGARRLLVEELQDQGFDVVAAADALEACDLMIVGTIPDIAILDPASAVDRGLWHLARLHHVVRTAAVGDGAGLVPLPSDRQESKALLDGCTTAVLQSPIISPPPRTQPVNPGQ